MWFLSWGPFRDLKLSAGALHTSSSVPPPSLALTSSAAAVGPASKSVWFPSRSSPRGLLPDPAPVRNHRRSCPASHLCCSDSAFIAHHVPLSHLLPYTSTGLKLPWRWSLLPTRVPPITAVSHKAADGASKQTELLSLMFSFSSAAQPGLYTAWSLVKYRWLTFWTVRLLSVPETLAQMHKVTGLHALNIKKSVTKLWWFILLTPVLSTDLITSTIKSFLWMLQFISVCQFE